MNREEYELIKDLVGGDVDWMENQGIYDPVCGGCDEELHKCKCSQIEEEEEALHWHLRERN